MLIIDKVILPDEKAIKTTDGELTFDIIKEPLYQNSMHLMLSWWDINMFYNAHSIKNYEIHMIRSALGECGSCGSRFQARCLLHNTYTRR